jgi:hypothetical protein
VLLSDGDASRSLALRAVARDGDALTVEAVAVDGDRRWRLVGPLLRVEEAAELGAWLAGLPGDLTLGADEWMTLTFTSRALSVAGRRVPGGVVELRVSVLGMTAEGSAVEAPSAARDVPSADGLTAEGEAPPAAGAAARTSDVVLGLRLPATAVERAAVAFTAETAALLR